MRFPAGKQSKLHREVSPKEVLNTVDTGYVRLTVETNGITDHYVLYRNKEVVGALCEFSDGRRFYGTEALDHISALDKKVLAQVAVYSEKDIDTIKKNHPEIFLAPESAEKFRVGDTVFDGILYAVRSGDLLTAVRKLEKENLTGCLRITSETEEALQEGAILFLKAPVAALFETETSVLLGDDALREIALAYAGGRVYKLERDFIENFLFLNNASRLKFPVEEVIASEKASDDLKRFIALQVLGLERGTLVLNAPCNGTFSFEALLKSAASRKFDGYLWVRSDNSQGLMVLGQGRIQAAYSMYAAEELTGVKALRKIYESMEYQGTVDFYQLSYPPKVEQSLEAEEETDSILVKRLMGEMGEDLIRDVSVAKEFKKKWEDKREKLGE